MQSHFADVILTQFERFELQACPSPAVEPASVSELVGDDSRDEQPGREQVFQISAVMFSDDNRIENHIRYNEHMEADTASLLRPALSQIVVTHYSDSVHLYIRRYHTLRRG